MAIAVTVAYIGFSIGFHVWSLNVRWYEPTSMWWTNGLLALFVIQRTRKTTEAVVKTQVPLYSISQLYHARSPGNNRVSFISVAAFYYYYYKRTALSISDPRFYEDSSFFKDEWTQ